MLDAFGAELSVVGAIAIDARSLPEISGLVSPEDFSMEAARSVYAAALALDREGTKIDPATLLNQCAKSGAPVSQEYIFEAMSWCGTATNAGLYAALVRENATRREVQQLCGAVAGRAESGGDVGELLTALSDGLKSIETRDTSAELVSTQAAIVDFMDYRSSMEQSGAKTVVATGLGPLDKLLGGGFLCGGLYVLGARPGVGKTTLALWICDSVARSVGPVLFVSLEMSTMQITAKRLARETGLPYTQLLMGELTEEEYGVLAPGSVNLSKLPLTVNRRPGATVADIGRMARRIPDLALVVVDYLGLVRPAVGKLSRYENTTQISNDLKQLSLALNVPVLALSQLNRENTQRQDKRPTLADLRDSGAVEQDADGVLLLHREDYYNEEEPSSYSLAECHLAKNRHGRTGTIQLSVFGDTGRIFPVTWRKEPGFKDLPKTTRTPWPD